MTLSMYEASVPVFTQLLTALDANLAKAATHAADRKIEPDALLRARLFPDMFELVRQVQIACDFAKSVPARLAGKAYLLAYGLPQFFFHVTTAYALLRHNGVEIGKKDFMGAY